MGVRCNGEYDWAQLLATYRIGSAAGYAQPWWGSPELSPSACLFLDRYATATPKPAYWCNNGTETVTEWVQKQKRVRERKPLLKNGKPVLRKGKPVYVWKVRIVTTTVPVQHVREIVVKCPGADEWRNYPYALWTLAHESYHLKGILDEAETDCYGLQAVTSVAKRLGASEQEAKTASDYNWTAIYPLKKTSYPAYWSAECRSGGALDLTPGDGIWP